MASATGKIRFKMLVLIKMVTVTGLLTILLIIGGSGTTGIDNTMERFVVAADGLKEGTQALYGRRIANRCDYRRLVTKDENVNNCRDANEDHNMGFDDIGCDPQYRNQIGEAIPEDDSDWELARVENLCIVNRNRVQILRKSTD